MTDTSSTPNRSTPQPHPVAALLTDKMRKRIKAVTFVHHEHPNYRAKVMAQTGRRWACPLGVALGRWNAPNYLQVCEVLGLPLWGDESRAICDFMDLVDNGLIEPEDVKPLLGVEP